MNKLEHLQLLLARVKAEAFTDKERQTLFFRDAEGNKLRVNDPKAVAAIEQLIAKQVS